MLCGMLQRGIRQAAETITQMTSVERILQFTQLEQEDSSEESTVGSMKLANSWPSKGKIEFKQFYLRYADDEEPVLKNVNIVIEPGWKVSIHTLIHLKLLAVDIIFIYIYNPSMDGLEILQFVE